MDKKTQARAASVSKSSKETTPTTNNGNETPEKVSTNSSSEEDKENASPSYSSSSPEPSQSPLVQLMTRTGYNIVQQNGQRRYGPPSTWHGSPPKRGCEIFVGKIPRDCFEDELIPAFERAGPVYEMRLMMDYNGQNRGYAFVVYCKANDAKESVKILDNYEIRKGRTLGVCMSVDNCRLFVGGIPKRVSKGDIQEEMEKVTEGVTDVIVYPSASDKSKNRGFAFVEYESHRAAAMARRKLMNGRVQLWSHPIAVDWAEPELEVAEEIMAQVKVLYVRNLMLTTTETQIMDAFSAHASVERVKKIRDYAFVHFHSRVGALKTMELLNGSKLDGAVIEVTLAKPVDKDTQSRNVRQQQQQHSLPPPPYSFLPLDYPPLFTSSLYSSYFPPSPKFVPRNSMGAKVIRSPRNSKGKTRNFYPISFSPQLVFPASPVHGPYMPQYLESPKRPQVSEEAIYEVVPGLDVSPAQPHQAPPSQHTTPPSTLAFKQPPIKTVVQCLEDICMKNNWGQPQYYVHSAPSLHDGQVFHYKVYIPALGTTYIPSKISRSVEEAHFAAAEYALVQLGCIDSSIFPPPPPPPPQRVAPPPPPPLVTADTLPLVPPFSPHAAAFMTLQTTPKTQHSAQPTWSPDTPIFTGYEHSPATGPPPPLPPFHHPFAHTDVYHRNF